MDLNVSGIYKISFSNNKVYIGMSCNIRRRLKEHRTSASQLKSMPVSRAMKTYNYTVEILEKIDDRNEMQEAEKKWIKFYQSNNKEYGYNLTAGGDGAGVGVNNHQAKLDEDTLQKVYIELKENADMYIYEIADKYNISKDAISEINNGVRYFNTNLTYPLRQPPGIDYQVGTKHHNAKLSELDLSEVVNLLENSSLTFDEIANIYKCSYLTISKLNRGLSYFNDSIDYPIRKTRTKTNALNSQQVLEIRDLLANTNLTMKRIATLFNVSVGTISRLNKGKTYVDSNCIYPIRRKKSDNKAVSTILESEE